MELFGCDMVGFVLISNCMLKPETHSTLVIEGLIAL